MHSRRKFIAQTAMATGSLLAGKSVFAGAAEINDIKKFRVYHSILDVCGNSVFAC